MDALIEKAACLCEPATAEEFTDVIWDITQGFPGRAKQLQRITHRISADCIPRVSIHCLTILGKADSRCNDILEQAGLEHGIYINQAFDRLLLIHPEEDALQHYVERFGTQLKALEIHNTTLPSLDLTSLTKLERLWALNNEKVSSINGLAQLTLLTDLRLFTFSNLTQLPGLEKLTQLRKLVLSNCSFAQLPALENLTQLTMLSLSRCNSLTQLPTLESFTQLTKLILSGYTNLTEIPSLEKLTQLVELNLSKCSNLIQVPSLENLTHLTELDLSECSNLRELPTGIRNMKALRRLDLHDLTLRELPDWLPEIAEHFSLTPYERKNGNHKAIVHLYHTTVEDIKDMSIFEQPYELVVKWFEERKLGRTQPLNEIKVVFLGDGEAGKSHTIARLMNDGGDPDHQIFDGKSTPGIVIRNKKYDIGGRKVQVHYWDFGGQEIMHSMHRIFLTGRTMYVVLLNARDDTQGDRARYWLHNVKSFAPDSPVLLVLNKIDQNENASVDEVDLRGRYGKLTQVVKLSALNFSREEFTSAFTNVLLDEIKKTGYLDAPWPVSWKQVKQKLENMSTHYILGDDYQAICNECLVDDNQKNLLHWFNDLGISFCCCDEEDYALEDYLILRPDWITNALYIILFNRLEGAHNGLIPHKSIYNLLKTAHSNPEIRCTLPYAKYNNSDIQYVLGVMRKFNLSFTDGHENEFVPMLCQQSSTVDVQYYREDADTLEFNMEFDYLPNNLLHRLMVDRHSELDMDNVWRTGAKFQFKELGFSAVVVIDGNILRFLIRHTDSMHRPNTYLTMLKANVDRIVQKMGLKAPSNQLIYKLDGKQDVFDFETLKAMQEAGQTQAFSMTWRRMIPIVDILNQSAPDSLDDEKNLLEAIMRSCRNIQGEPDYRLNGDGHGMEDKRNRRIRDDLFGWGYNIQDQSQRGRSGNGSGIGELDLLLHNDKKELWTTIEALRVSNGTKAKWNEHLNKLVGSYNFFGARFMYLLTYVDADPKAFVRIWNGYKDHIKQYNPGEFTYASDSFVDLDDASSPQYVKTVKCQYACDGELTTVYHIFVRIPTQNE